MNMVENKIEQQGCYKLWSDCFGDSKQYMDYYFTEKTKDNEIYQIEKDGEIISMLHLNPFQFLVKGNPMKLHYIVGVATKEEERGKGLMRQLLTETLCLQHERGELFTYLMPAAKEIYLPYDFRYMYTQRRMTGTLPLDGEKEPAALTYESLSDGKKQEVVSFVNARLEQQFDCVTDRDLAYYERLCKEMQAAGGNVVVMQEEDRLLGVASFMLENGHLEVTEQILRLPDTKQVLRQLIGFIQENYEDTSLEASWLETNDIDTNSLRKLLESPEQIGQPIIMARLLCVKEAFELLSLLPGQESRLIKIRVEDPIIKENNQSFVLVCDQTGIKAEPMEVPQEGEIKIPIAELTEWFFGVRRITGLEGISTVSRPFINEIV